MQSKQNEPFFNGYGKGHILIKNGSASPAEPIQCIPSEIYLQVKQIENESEVPDILYLTYTKNGGPPQVMRFAPYWFNYGIEDAMINLVRNEDNTGVAFKEIFLEPTQAGYNRGRIEGISSGYEFETDEGLEYAELMQLDGSSSSGVGVNYTGTGRTKIVKEQTTIRFIPSVDVSPEFDMFYSLEGYTEGTEFMEVTSCAYAEIPIYVPPPQYDNNSNATTFTTTNSKSLNGELPITLSFPNGAESITLTDANTGEILIDNLGNVMVGGITRDVRFGNVYTFYINRPNTTNTNSFILTGYHDAVKIEHNPYGSGEDEVAVMSLDGPLLLNETGGDPFDSHGLVAVTTMSYTVTHYIFEIVAANLTVPRSIPSSINTFNETFKNCTLFDQDLSGWLTDNINDMEGMFKNCHSFNQDLSSWNTYYVTSMQDMFEGCTRFNGDVSTWDVSNVQYMWNLFNGCAAFNQDISGWVTSQVEDMDSMFMGCANFNQNLGAWDVSLVEYFSAMFKGCLKFNQDIGGWLTSSCNHMGSMFYGASSFNQDISEWDVSLVENMDEMFTDALMFNKDLSGWCVPLISSTPSDFDTGARNYVADRPVWGTCPGGDIVTPPVDDPGLQFTLINDDSVAGTTPLSISLTNPPDNWAVLADGEVIASIDGLMPHVTKKLNYNGSVLTLTIATTANSNITYNVQGTYPEVMLQTSRTYSEEVPKVLVVTRFSPGIEKHKFNLPSTELAVPDTLPMYFTHLNELFNGCDNFNQDLSGWDVSNIVSMAGTFSGCTKFNGNISNWDVSKVTSFTRMFRDCENFTRDITNWTVSSGTDFSSMFSRAFSFNQNISRWNMSQATDISSMFEGCVLFNQDIGTWDVRNVRNISYLFSGCSVFNKNVNGWQLSGIDSMYSVFQGCSEYNQPLDNWDMSLVTGASQMLKDCAKFNQDIGGWNFSSLLSATGLLEGCTVFNQDISGWAMGNVVDTEAFFKGCAAFNQDISGWGMGSARSLQNFFNGALSFNQDISGWDVSNVEYFSGSFVDAASFNQDLSWWCVSQERFGPSVPYDKGAVSWGLPHISWGQCIRGEDVGTSDSYVKPPQPTNGLIWTQGFNKQQLEIRIKVTGLVGEWALWHGRFILVSSTKTDNYITVYESEDKTSVEIQIDRGMLRTLQFVGVADEVRFEVYDPDESDVALGYFDVLQYSETVTNHKFNLPDLDLTLPDTPPPIAPTNMYRMFKDSNRFNQDLSAWDVSQVTTMRDAFKGCSTFNSDLSGWVTTAVKSMIGTFSGCKVFNQDLSGWCVSNYDFEPPAFTTDCFNWVLPKPVWGTCSGTSNQPELVDLNSDKIVFEVSLEDVRYMNMEVRLSISNVLPGWKLVDSETGIVLCQPLGSADDTTDVNPAVAKSVYWKKSAGSHMDSMRVDIVISSLEPKRYELHGTGTHLDVSNSSQLFDPHPTVGLLNIKQWSTNVAQYRFGVGNFDLIVPPKLPPHITSMEGMFRYSNQFNQDLDTWDTSNVTNMAECFLKAYKFNGRIGTWDVGNVTNMTDFMSTYDQFHNQFSGDFNQDVSKWNVSNVTNMTRMFARHTKFNQDLTAWCVTHVASTPPEFVSYGFDVANLPVWGTCPITLTGAMSDTAFTVDNTIVADDDLTLKITVTNLTNDLILTREGEKLMDGTGSLNVDVFDFYRNGDAWVSFVVRIKANSVASFRLNSGAASNVRVEYSDGPWVADSISGLIDFTQLSESAIGYSIKARWFDVKVPDTLPRSITSLDSMFAMSHIFNQDLSGWDTSNVTSMSSTFYVCNYFNQDLSGWDVSNVTDFSSMFQSASKFNHDISMWDTSSAVRMYGMFNNAKVFNQDISGWNVSNVETMQEMFESAVAFNQDISMWDMSGIISDGHMSAMFKYARAFNQDLSWWCMTNVTDKPYEFDLNATAWTLSRPVWGACPSAVLGLEGNTEFTVDNTIAAGNPIELVVEFELVNDDVFIMRDGKVIADSTGSVSPEVVMTYMQFNQYKLVLTVPEDKVCRYVMNPGLAGAVTIKHTQGSGDVNGAVNVTKFSTIANRYSLQVGRLGLTVPSTLPRSIEYCNEMFYGCINFNQDLSGWDMSNIRGIANMFTDCRLFNQPVGGWRFSPSIRDLTGIFKGCTNFNQDLNGWEVGDVTYLSSMFDGAASFNGDITGWDVGSSYAFSDMFKGASSFNQDIGGWDMSAVEHYNGLANMFNGATSFNQDLSGWDMSSAAMAPTGFSTGTSSWVLPKPLWGTSGIRSGFFPIDISGASGTYLTVSRSGGEFVTFNFTDPSFNKEQFEAFIVMGQSPTTIAFLDWPAVFDESITGPNPTPGICGLTSNGSLVTELHPEGLFIEGGFSIGGVALYPPYTVTSQVNTLTVKQTDSAPAGYDIFRSLPGATEGGTLTVTSTSVIHLA